RHWGGPLAKPPANRRRRVHPRRRLSVRRQWQQDQRQLRPERFLVSSARCQWQQTLGPFVRRHGQRRTVEPATNLRWRVYPRGFFLVRPQRKQNIPQLWRQRFLGPPH